LTKEVEVEHDLEALKLILVVDPEILLSLVEAD